MLSFFCILVKYYLKQGHDAPIKWMTAVIMERLRNYKGRFPTSGAGSTIDTKDMYSPNLETHNNSEALVVTLMLLTMMYNFF